MYSRRIDLVSAFFSTVLAALILISSAIADRAANIDTTFGSRGRITTTVCGGVFGGEIYVQPSGRAIYAGDVLCSGFMLSFRSTAAVAVTKSGELDQTFGNAGKILIKSDYASYYYSGSAMQPDGKLLLYFASSIPDGSVASYYLTRYTVDGAIDPTFNASVPSVLYGGFTDLGVSVGSDGKITILALTPTLSLIRFNADGSRDQTFGSNGIKPLPASRLPNTTIVGMVIDDRGKIVIGYKNGTAARLNSDGELDRSFGRQGIATEYLGAGRAITFSTMIRQNDGKLIFGGTSTNPQNLILFRYTQRGRPDAGYGTNGLVDSPIGPGGSGATGLAFQSDGKMIVTGYSVANGAAAVLTARFANDGTLERWSRTSFPDLTGSSGSAVAVQADGKIVTAGNAAPPTYLGTRAGLEFLRFTDGNFGAGAIAKLNDFDGDGRTDLSVYRSDPTGVEQSFWDIRTMSGASLQTYFGISEDIPVPQDYDDDGKTNVAVFRPSNGTWYYETEINSDNFTAVQFGQQGDIPIPNDFDGDRKADFVIFRPQTATWMIKSSIDGSVRTVQFGNSTDTPVTGDFDGDGKADIAVWRSQAAEFRILISSDGQTVVKPIGAGGDTPVIADYDNDRISDIAVFGPTGTWKYVRSFDGQTVTTSYGTRGDVPVPGDYSGDGSADIGVFRSSNTTWNVTWPVNNGFITQFGQPNDLPLPGR